MKNKKMKYTLIHSLLITYIALFGINSAVEAQYSNLKSGILSEEYTYRSVENSAVLNSLLMNKKQSSQSDITYGIIGGLGYGSLRYFKKNDSVKAQTKPERYIGLMAEFPIRKVNEHLFADIELALSQFNSHAYNPHVFNPEEDTEGTYRELLRDFSPYNLNIALMLKYNITLTDFHPYAFVGINNNIVLSSTNNMTQIVHYQNTTDTVYLKAIDNLAVYGMSVVSGVGIEYKWFSLEARYQSGRNYNVYDDVQNVFRPVLYGLLRIKMFRKSE